MMLENCVEYFTDSLFLCLTGKTVNARGLLVKKHTENLETHGDFSFPNTSKSWNGYIPQLANANDSLLQCISKTREDIVAESRNWKLCVKHVKEDKGRVYLYLERPGAISLALSEGLKNTEVISQRLREQSSTVRIDPQCEASNCLTSLRVKYLSKVIENLCSITFREENLPKVFVTSKSSSTSSGVRILCSTVLSAKTSKKEMDVIADDFIRLRQDDMTRVAQHKYGVRVTTDSKWREFIEHLGESAAAFELLEVRPTSVVKINIDHMAGGSSKGAAFILYNCARLETIIRTYEDNVTKGMYPPLPEFDKVDFSLLTQEDEWNLLFNYIMGFPQMLVSCIDSKGDECEFRPHFICGFLCSMVRVFSQYYRKTRILVEPRVHLLPTIYARMHFLIVLNNTLKTCLKILNIKSVSQM